MHSEGIEKTNLAKPGIIKLDKEKLRDIFGGKEEFRALLQSFGENYTNQLVDINNKVLDIKIKVSKCDPLKLLKYAASMNMMASLNKFSEFEYEQHDVDVSRAAEYLQSILVSSENHFNKDNGAIDQSKLFSEILADLENLHQEIMFFYFCWREHVKATHPDIDSEMLKFIGEAQMLYAVRGNNYQALVLDILEKLLTVHEKIFKELFCISVKEFLDGLKRIQYALTNGQIDCYKKIISAHEKFVENVKTNADVELYMKENAKELSECFEEAFRFSLHNVEKVTSWPIDFIKKLSLNLNEDCEFFSRAEYAGWPIVDLPVQKKPFICVDNVYYCFDYYSLFDNIYRVLQKIICRLQPEYQTTWKDNQQLASEIAVEDLFKKLLPGCMILRNNYYPINKSTKNFAENDILILYDSVIFIIEVKAGSFVYTPPIADYEAHIKSYKTLLEKADCQCSRTYQYIISDKLVNIYDEKYNIKTTIDNSNFDEIYTFSVTVDNIGDFAARAEKLSFLRLQCNAIAICLADLQAYSIYFDNPLKFLHYLKQRKIATTVPKICVNDELDHLGMYIEHNVYSITASELDQDAEVHWFGYRQKLDKYFSTLNLPQLKISKPEQAIPLRMVEILNALISLVKIDNKHILSNFLLDCCEETRIEFANLIDSAIKRQRKISAMAPLTSIGGDCHFCIFVHQEGLEHYPESKKIDYVFATIISNHESSRMLINLYYDRYDKLYDIDFRLLKFDDIPQIEYPRLGLLGEQIKSHYVENYIKQTGCKKIGRNELCPCGSGKKFKKCCGK